MHEFLKSLRAIPITNAILVSFAVLISAGVSDEPQDQPRTDGPETVKQRSQALEKEYGARRKAPSQSYNQAETEQEKQKIEAELLDPLDAEYARKFLELARGNPKDPAALDALYLAIYIGRHSPESEAAIEQIRRDWVKSPGLARFLQQLGKSPNPNTEALLRDVLEENPDRDARGQACLALGFWLEGQAEIPRTRVGDPQLARWQDRTYGKEQIDRMAQRNPEALLKEAESLFDRAVAQYADVKLHPEYPKNPLTIGGVAADCLGQRRDLAVGKPAPEIEGQDFDGKPMRLSDYRGKVVVLVFWASWCGPCVEQIPYERELAKRLDGKPFALLGVNIDFKKDAAKATLAKEQITWPNWYDGMREWGPGPIGARYHILGAGATYVLDPHGIILSKDMRGEALGKAVDAWFVEHPASR